jgi:hypothetical protein
MNAASEEWRYIPGYENYQITVDGRIRLAPDACPRKRSSAGFTPLMPGQFVKQHLAGGYWRVNVRGADGKYASRTVHRLLMLTYSPPTSPGLQINHIDGNKQNNSLDNLEWVTHRQNLDHAWVTGLRKRPRRDILSAEDVRKIRATYVKGRSPSLRDIGAIYGVTPHAIHRVVRNKNWKHV